ncbi:MAG TPA: PKD domain-containing protein, partial [Thermoplasmata archaeon]|nr:PKD domain-containing protein [Thermoplasmata archaeon]
HLYNTGYEDYPKDITVDSHGDIIVTGYSAIGDHDYVTIKYMELFGNKTPKARFTYTPITPQVFDTIQFTDQSMDPDGNITTWFWDFGDNNISTQQNPSHRYEKSGIYIVSLTVTDNKGKPDNTQRIVVVESGENTEHPIANFDYHPVNPKPGDTVEFSDTSTDFDGMITQRLWVFHDNSTATAENVTFTYTQNGTYPVTLIVMDNDGASDVKQKNVVVYVDDENQPPQANFAYTPASPTVNETIQFIDESMDEDGYIVQWLWDFGDNTTSSASHPTHSYNTAGTYTVTLTVVDNGNKTNFAQQTITVKTAYGNQPPTADFTYSPKHLDTETMVQFKDLSTDSDGIILRWLWDFGDGETSGEQNPVHRYTSAGMYTVTLNVTDNNGDSNFKIKQIQVETYIPPTPPSPSSPPPTPQQQTEENVLKTTLNITPQNVNGENGWYTVKPTINLTASKPATIYYHWDEKPKKIYVHNLTAPEGVHTLFYYSIDMVGNREEEQWKTIKVDTTKPYLKSVYPENNSFINNTKPVLKLNFNEKIQIMHSTLDEKEIVFKTQDNTTFTVNTFLSEGKHKLNIEVKDEAGNNVFYTTEFTVDTVKPTVKVDLPNADEVVSEKTVYIKVNATDNYGINQIEFNVIQDNTVLNTSKVSAKNLCTFVFNASSYQDGEYNLLIRVFDKAGNKVTYSTNLVVSKEKMISLPWLLLFGVIGLIAFLVAYVIVVKKTRGKTVFQSLLYRMLRNH